MSADANQARNFLANLGLRVSIKQVSVRMLRTMRHVKQGEHLVEWREGIDPDRMMQLLQYYFGDYTEVEYGSACVKLDNFNPDGHGDTGICKKCGCTQNDGCHDDNTGTCYWVLEDLCSACATPAQKNLAMDEMKELFKAEEL